MKQDEITDAAVLDPTPGVEQPEVVADGDANVVAEAPTVGKFNKLSVYFVLDSKKVRSTGDETANKLGQDAVSHPATFIEISMNFVSEEPGEIHNLLRNCVGVIVQTKDSDGKPQVTPLAVANT